MYFFKSAKLHSFSFFAKYSFHFSCLFAVFASAAAPNGAVARAGMVASLVSGVRSFGVRRKPNKCRKYCLQNLLSGLRKNPTRLPILKGFSRNDVVFWVTQRGVLARETLCFAPNPAYLLKKRNFGALIINQLQFSHFSMRRSSHPGSSNLTDFHADFRGGKWVGGMRRGKVS